MENRIRLWYLYDFAKSFASVVLIFYYPLMLAEKGASNVWIGVSASISTAILLVSLPLLGNFSDRTGKRIYFIRVASILMVVSLFVLAFIMQNSEVYSTPLLFLLSFFYILFQVCFQGSYVFYSAMLRTMTDSSNNAKVSGIGLGFGQLGNAIALLVIGPIIGGASIIIGLHGKPLALLLGGIFFAILSIPFLKQKDIRNDGDKVGFSYRGFLKKLVSNKRIFLFIVGYSLLSDAILTFQLYLAVYMSKVFSLSDKLVTYAGIAGLIGCVVGGFFASKIAYKLKNEEKTLRLASLMYAVCFGLCALMPQITILIFVVLFISGISYGLVFSLARTVYSKISPDKNQAEFFSIYTVFERAASIIGPLVWLITFYLLKNFGEHIQYRGSVLLLMLICICGFYYLTKSNKISKMIQR